MPTDQNKPTGSATVNKMPGHEHMSVSVFRMVSLGVVAANKPPSTRIAEVFPTELTPFADGEINPNPQEISDSGSDNEGVPYQAKVMMVNTIQATWLPFRTNQRTAPDVRRGEHVVLWQVDNSPKYYWTVLGLDDNLRRLETVMYVFSATATNDDVELDFTNSYILTISTHSGLVELSTSKANGEPYAYKMQLDTKNGAFALTDDKGDSKTPNYITLDSAEDYISAGNAQGTYYELAARVMNLFAPDTLNQQANTINMKAKTINQQADNINVTATTLTTKATNATTNVEETYTLQAQTITETFTTKNSAGAWNHTGPVGIAGILGVSGIATVGGLAAAGGALSVSPFGIVSNVAFQQNNNWTVGSGVSTTYKVIVNGIDCGSTHFHQVQGPSGPTSVPEPASP